MRTTDVRVLRAITAIDNGQPIVLSDGSDGDGYLVFAADAATPRLLHFAVRHSCGYVRVALPTNECARLDLPPMCPGDSGHCVSVDLRGTGTGISAVDRAKTIAALACADSAASDFQRPGHVIPTSAFAGGLLARRGPAEASIDLARLAGRRPAAGLCEVVSRRNPTLIARGTELLEFAVEHGLAVVSIDEIEAYRRRTEPQVVRLTETTLPTWAGHSRVIGFRDVHGSPAGGGEHLAVIVGSVDAGVPVPVHVHVECLTGDVFGSKACRCGGELSSALRRMSAHGSGVVIYLRPAGLPRACGLFSTDAPDTSNTVNWILRDLGVFALKLSDDMPGFGLVLFGAIREHGIGTLDWAVAG